MLEREQRHSNTWSARCQPHQARLGLLFPAPQLQRDWKSSSVDRTLHKIKKLGFATQAFSCKQLATTCFSPIKCSGDLRSSKSQKGRRKTWERWLHNWKQTSFFLITSNKITSSIEGWIPVTDPLRMSSLSLYVSLNKPWKLILIKCSSKTKLPSTKHLKASVLSWKIQKEILKKSIKKKAKSTVLFHSPHSVSQMLLALGCRIGKEITPGICPATGSLFRLLNIYYLVLF